MVWGSSKYGATNAPTDKGYIKIYSNATAFATLKADGSITAWGSPYFAFAPPEFESPHALIEPLALRAAKAYAFE
jgi:hypothetical protein